MFERLGLWPDLLIHDPDINESKDIFTNSNQLDLNEINLVKRIQSKLRIQESSSSWQTSISIYAVKMGRVITLDDATPFEQNDLQSLKQGWQVVHENENYQFYHIAAYPYSALRSPESASLIIKVQFNSDTIQGLLDKFKKDGRRDPFFYKKGVGVIFNRSADQAIAEKVLQEADRFDSESNLENKTVTIEGKPYMVNIVTSEYTGWQLIDFMPLSEILQPIQTSNYLFYFTIGFLLLMSCLAAYFLYVQVQLPLKKLIHNFQRLKIGDYSVRIPSRGNSEFSYLFVRFNSMAEQIQDLFEKVYQERIRVKEARLKQLQSQINPHFFYNCFSFISSMAKMKNYDSVVAMSQNLSRYYRYVTRQERDVVPLSQEIEFVTNYLEIQRMRMKRLSYRIDLPDEMGNLEIPLLLIQPIVENAVIHGIENCLHADKIWVVGSFNDDLVQIIIDDNGIGMSEDVRMKLLTQFQQPLNENTGCGLWNVVQRLKLRYGEDAVFGLESSPLGGVRVVLKWHIPTEEIG